MELLQQLESASNDYAVALFYARGYLVLEDVFNDEELNNWQKAIEQTAGGTAWTNLPLPVQSPFLDGRLAENPAILNVVDPLIGADCVLRVLSAVKPGSPGEANAEVSMPGRPLFPDSEHLRFPPHQLIVTIPFTALDERSGSPEVWPGTQSLPEHMNGKYGPGTMRRIADELPSERVRVPRGAVLIRDSRMWTRARAADLAPAEALQLVYQRWWDITGTQLKVTEAVHEGLSPRLRKLVRFEKIPHRKA